MGKNHASLNPTPVGRAIKSNMLLMAGILALAACGGGGGGSTPVAPTPPAPPAPAPAPPPAPAPQPGITGATKPTIAVGEGVATSDVTVSVPPNASTENLVLQGPRNSVQVRTSGTFQIEVFGVAEQRVELKRVTQVLDTRTVKADCDTGSGWDQGVTDTCYPLQSYQNLVAARHAFSLFSRLTVERGIELPANKTGYATPQWVIDNGGSRFGGCALLRDPQGENGVKKDAFGRLEGACTDAVDLVIRPVRISLTENAMYSGGTHTIPVAELANDVHYISSCDSIGQQPFADWGQWLELSTGWFFVYTGALQSQFPIYWQSKGNPLPAPVMVEPESPFQWGLSCVKKFSFTAPGQ